MMDSLLTFRQVAHFDKIADTLRELSIVMNQKTPHASNLAVEFFLRS